MKIAPSEYHAAYAHARKVHAGTMRPKDAKKHLVDVGLNSNSAADFIYIFRQMVRGQIYKRAMSADATKYFIRSIRRDYGEAVFQNALAALRAHIPYNGGAMLGHLAILDKYGVARPAEPDRGTGLDDLDSPPTGSELPDRAKRIAYVFRRDNKVRAHVLKRANGKCEHCGSEGFLLPDGNRYVEAHHVIALASAGRDTIQNVIGLCPDHHREAHYGASGEELEAKFIQQLLELNSDKRLS